VEPVSKSIFSFFIAIQLRQQRPPGPLPPTVGGFLTDLDFDSKFRM